MLHRVKSQGTLNSRFWMFCVSKSNSTQKSRGSCLEGEPPVVPLRGRCLSGLVAAVVWRLWFRQWFFRLSRECKSPVFRVNGTPGLWPVPYYNIGKQPNSSFHENDMRFLTQPENALLGERSFDVFLSTFSFWSTYPRLQGIFRRKLKNCGK